jgi:glycosyltransferase involved in cell wall biosynthesis
MPAIEAQALGAPLICSDRSALPEVAGEAALLVNPEDATSLAAAIDKLINDPALADTMREKGLKNARNFSWKRTASLTLATFAQHLNSH